jgi:beta-lactamase regulating signal transducer with metallopeptidase domain
MSYVLRGIAVSFAIFFVVYASSSVAVLLTWRGVWRHTRRFSARTCCNLLFALRMAPLLAAMAVTFLLAVPSFLIFEPRAMQEETSPALLALALCGIALLLIGFLRAWGALRRVAETIAIWSQVSHPVDDRAHLEFSGSPISLLRTSAAAPPLTAAGILRPVVWISSKAESVLNPGELSSALRHEAVHVLHRDNLKKLFLRAAVLPGTAHLESAWREATEIAADDAAVSSASEALDLAAAVIKLSRLAPVQAPAELTTALVHSPAESLDARVKRLLEWSDRRQTPVTRTFWIYLLCPAAMLTMLALSYGSVLLRVHAATEWLVR